MKLRKYIAALIAFIESLTTAAIVQAQGFGSGGGLPIEGPLETVLQSLQGPIARYLISIAIIVAGLGIAFGEGGSVWRKLAYVALGASITFGVASLVATLGGGG
jgi:type IV secretory pathway VirB2 component (pilin)